MTRRMIAAWLLASSFASLHAEGIQPSVAVYYPGVPWYLRYEMEGVLEEYNNHKPSRGEREDRGAMPQRRARA